MIPVGAYMVIHLLTNASVLQSSVLFQKLVYQIHGLPMLLAIEWVFIFIPILFHAIIGVLIIRGSLPNSGTYKYGSNIRYTLQRATGMIAFAFILFHVFHMHGWFHFKPWVTGVVEPLGGGQFEPYNAASTAATALSSVAYQIFYVIGVLSCVFHLANGIWTFGITWGIWVTPAAQRWATTACLVFGLGLSAVGLGALGGFAYTVDVEKARQQENEMYELRVKMGDILPDEHKRFHPMATKPAETAALNSEPSSP